ncbi:MAG: excinuclease ABC subunit UvrA [Armatimonadota bacterium]
MPTDKIVVRGARQHNLKNITVEIPRDKLVVITGLSGSGKSSLAFDTIYAEGQRRYVESLSAYARQFLGEMDKPDVDFIDGLSPAVSIDQKSTTRNPRSTVATVTEIYDHMRLLWARIGLPHCPQCGRPIVQQTAEQIVDQVLQLPEGTRVLILGPVVKGRKGEYHQIFEDIRRQGFARVRVDGNVVDVSEAVGMRLARYKQHSIDIVVDRIVVRGSARKRLADSMELALKVGSGIALVQVVDGEEMQFSEKFACMYCQRSFEELQPRMFSFNTPYGACPECTGLGTSNELDESLIIPDRRLSINEGALLPWRSLGAQYHKALLRAVCEHFDIDLDAPIEKLPKERLDVLLRGSDEPVRVRFRGRGGRLRVYDTRFRGIMHYLQQEFQEGDSESARDYLTAFTAVKPCSACKGQRLKPESLAVTVADRNIAEVAAMSIRQATAFFDALAGTAGDTPLSAKQQQIARQVLKEIRTRLGFLMNVGLEYLTLGRAAATLAGGEAQRIRLATQIGSGLVGVLYILDEPSIGLHQRDNRRLLTTLRNLRDLGNTMIVGEHDEETIRTADWIIDIGPGAGEHGGEVVVEGTLRDILSSPRSITGDYLAGRRRIPVPSRRESNGHSLTVKGARQHNLKNIDVRIPLGVFTCLTGVSGSGKSTLMEEILYRRLANKLHGARTVWGSHDDILGVEHIDKIIDIDQSPIGRTPRSNPATYTGVFGRIRDLFAQTPEARMRGYKPGRFSFNVRGGRCEACKGDGIIKIEMQFLPDVYVSCEVCHGARYNRETLEVAHKGKSIADVLTMTVEEALEFFKNIPGIAGKLQTINDVGLNYIQLGQPATTLSGGEAQRVKLASELSRRDTGRTLYLLDEPTTGLHFADIHKLLEVLRRLTAAGNTVLVIEHNPDVIKCADYIIDLGPEGGDEGGYIVAEGTPEQVAEVTASYTGEVLRHVLAKDGEEAIKPTPSRTRARRRAPVAVTAA